MSKGPGAKRGLVYELPEVETVRHDLERDLIGKRVKTVEAVSMKCLSRYQSSETLTEPPEKVSEALTEPPEKKPEEASEALTEPPEKESEKASEALTEQLAKAKISSVKRVGLHLLIGLDSGSQIVVSLGSTGSLRRNAAKNPVLPGTEVVISFTQHGHQLRYVDPEGTGDLFVAAEDSLEAELPEIAKYGFDPMSEPISWTDFGRRLLARSVKLKRLLTDDTFVTGIRNIYADEILFEAGLRYDRISNTLSSQEIRRLHRSLVGTIHDAIKYRGASLPERQFCDPFGETGNYAGHLQVWGRHGALSSRSRAPIKRVRFGRTWTYYCDTQV